MSVRLQACVSATVFGMLLLALGLPRAIVSAQPEAAQPEAVQPEAVQPEAVQPEAELPSTSRRLESQAGSFQRQRNSTASTSADSPVFDLNLGTVQEGPGGGDGATGEGGNGSNSVGGPGNGNSNSRGQGGSGSGTGAEQGVGNNSGSGNGRGPVWDGNGDGDGGTGGISPSLGIQDPGPAVTGLIVDARQLDFVPSMSMRLYDPDGNQVYTTLDSNRDLNTYQVSSNGTALFVTTEEDAHRLVNRIGDRPTTVTAYSTLGYDLVLNNEDAWDLRQQNDRDRFLDNFSVVVIWTP